MGNRFPDDRIIYKIEIDESNKYIQIYYFTFFRRRTKIPFQYLHTESAITKKKNVPKLNLKITFWKKSLPKGSIQLICNDYLPNTFQWKKDDLVQLSKVLNCIKHNYPTWKMNYRFNTWWRKGNKIVDEFD